MSVKYEYEGSKQKIIPLSITQYNTILQIVLDLNNKNYRIKHTDFKNLLEHLYNKSITSLNCDEWLCDFDNIISNWKCSLTTNIFLQFNLIHFQLFLLNLTPHKILLVVYFLLFWVWDVPH